ncbi:MAG TPA: N-acetylmuramoyl-L-alanine amidase [Puia sp.]|nr:N-acetylmuramoyl-L-alanine amidase [Puia sp.]
MKVPIGFSAFSLLLLWLSACKPNPYRATNKEYRRQSKEYAHTISESPLATGADSVPAAPYWVGTVNFNLRKPNFVIIHHTAQNGCPETLHTFTIRQSQVSAHYVICKDGTVHHMLNDYLRAWQAGLSKWGNNSDINSSSIGIELDNNGFEYFTDSQIASLLILLDTLKSKYKIPQENFIGHGDIAPGRKVDPNWRFPWKLLADHGFGDWYGDTSCVVVPAGFNNFQALRIIGFNIRDTVAAVTSFRRHWLQDSVYKPFDSASEKILYDLSLRYQ